MNESEVARKIGVSRQAMYDYRVRHDIKYDQRKAKQKTYTEKYSQRNAKIVDLYISGMPMDKICVKFNMNKPAINYILLKYKVKKPMVYPSIKRNMEIYRRRKNGASVKDMAKEYKLDPKYVSTMIYKMKQKELSSKK
jgi:DNA-binding CsgD family transcriptional regulator